MNKIVALLLFLLTQPHALLGAEYDVPCKVRIEDFAVSADGKSAWVVCLESDSIDKAHSAKLPPPAARDVPRSLYYLDLATSSVRVLKHVKGGFRLYPAPTGNRVLVASYGKGEKNEIFLSDHLATTIPRLHGPVLWSSDGKRLYFSAGVTEQSEGFNILGILNVSDNRISEKRIPRVGDWIQLDHIGHLLIGTPFWNSSADALYARFSEYDREGRFVRQLPNAPCGTSDRTGRYVATADSYHGPLDWAILNVSSEQPIEKFRFSGERVQGEFAFAGWNPKIPTQLLLLPSDLDKIEVFDLQTSRVIETFAGSGPVQWAADGKGVIISQGSTLRALP